MAETGAGTQEAGAPGSAPPASRDRGDRNRLALVGLAMAVGGILAVAYLGSGLLQTLPPTYGHTLSLFIAAAVGFLLLGTGALYMHVARDALEVTASPGGLDLGHPDLPGDVERYAWDRVTSVRLSEWRLGPWLGRSPFCELEVVAADGVGGTGRAVVVHVRDFRSLLAKAHANLGDRLDLSPVLLRSAAPLSPAAPGPR